MKSATLALIVLVSVWLQVSFLGALRPFGVMPNLALVVIIIAGLAATASQTLVLAVSMGVLLDFMSGADFGLRTAFLCLLALLVIVLRRSGAEFERLGLVAALVLSATLLFNAAIITTLLALKVSLLWPNVIRSLGIELGLNLLILLVLRQPLALALKQHEGVVGSGAHKSI